jgi:aminoglycoside phosphotransferase (APT) family kinase protein
MLRSEDRPEIQPEHSPLNGDAAPETENEEQIDTSLRPLAVQPIMLSSENRPEIQPEHSPANDSVGPEIENEEQIDTSLRLLAIQHVLLPSDNHPEIQTAQSPVNDDLGPETENEDQIDMGSDCSSSVYSDSSSLVYDHEPFESFQAKVLNLAITILEGVDTNDIEVTRMKGGGFNRIIGISTKGSAQEENVEYVLRIPRFDAARMDQDVAALNYVKKLGNIPVPDIVAFDETSNNKLGDPYMVQKKLAGTVLLSTFPDLDQNQKIRVATELGQVFNRMLSKKTTVAGKLILPWNVNKSEDMNEEISLEPLFQAETPTLDLLEPNLATRDLLSRIFEERKIENVRNCPANTIRPWLSDQFTVMANELHDDGWFASNQVSLCHLDFEPRNILIDTARDAAQPIISGILDWDSAALAPSFMSCAPPLWIWAWADDEDEDERTANDVPPTEENRALKSAFEEAAGAEFVRYAYPSAYRLARRLIRFAIDGQRSNEDLKEAEAMLAEWKEIRVGSAVETSWWESEM